MVIAAEQARMNKDSASMIAAMSKVSKMMGFYAKQLLPDAKPGDGKKGAKRLELMTDKQLLMLQGAIMSAHSVKVITPLFFIGSLPY